MANLISFNDKHEYIIDGEKIPSVSELTRFISREVYGNIMQSLLERAAERGTKVHKATEVLDKYGTVEADASIVEYVQAYVKFRKEHNVEWDKIEYGTYSKANMYAGTMDRVGKVDNQLCLLDIKTSSTLQKVLYTAQLNLYRKILEEQGIKVERLVILHLKKDGTYKLVDIDIEDTLADSCLTLHKALQKKRRKKK